MTYYNVIYRTKNADIRLDQANDLIIKHCSSEVQVCKSNPCSVVVTRLHLKVLSTGPDERKVNNELNWRYNNF